MSETSLKKDNAILANHISTTLQDKKTKLHRLVKEAFKQNHDPFYEESLFF